MNCPIDEIMLIDYLEGELDPETARRVEQHLESCPTCRTEYESLLKVKKVLAGAKESAVDEPGESFWKENLEAVARATYRKDSSSVSMGKVLIFRRFTPRILAAAAVVLLALAGALKLGLGPLGTREMPSAELAQVSAEDQAYIDSLYRVAETVYQYQIVLNAMESMVELAADQEGGYTPAGMEVPAYSSVYDGLAELEDSQLEQVMYSLASDL
jgi:hypothetical protein